MSGTQPGAVPFDYSLWQTCYPEFASVSSGLASFAWAQAELYLNNTAGSVVWDSSRAGRRNLLLNMLTAHIVKLMPGPGGEAAPVGRISNASEGSVSVAFDMPASPNAAWFMQTQYGAAFWQATAQYRTMRYNPGPQPYLGVSRPFGGRGW